MRDTQLPDGVKKFFTVALSEASEECRARAGKTISFSEMTALLRLLQFILGLSAELYKADTWQGQPALAWMMLLRQHPSIVYWYSLQSEVKVERTPSETMLYLMVKQTASPPSQSSSTMESVATDKTVGDFEREFHGNGMRYLRNHLIRLGENYDPKRHYARVVPIIQSSGSGKSKTAVELAQVELGILVCVRKPPGELKPVSQPPRDDLVATWLIPSEEAPESKSVMLMIWLTAFANKIVAFYCTLWESTQSGPWPTNNNVSIDVWSDFVRIAAEDLRPSLSSSPHPSSKRNALLKEIDRSSTRRLEEAREARLRDKRIKSEDQEKAMLKELRKAWKNLDEMLPTANSFFHLTIDECGSMAKNLAELRHIINAVDPKNSWILLLDTSTHISTLAGETAVLASDRVKYRILTLVEPFTFLPIDVGLSAVQAEFGRICQGQPDTGVARKESNLDGVDLRHVSLSRYLRLMGRPMLNDDWLLDRTPSITSETPSKKTEEHLRLRQEPPNDWSWSAGVNLGDLADKLMFYPDADLELTNEGVIALITQRLPLRIPGFQGKQLINSFKVERRDQPFASIQGLVQARKLAETLVEIHLRRIDQVLPFGIAILTHTPSEPLLSLAATHTFRKEPATLWRAAIAAIFKNTNLHNFSIGEAGEEYVQIVLTASLDSAAVSSTRHNLAPVLVHDWLEALLNPRIPKVGQNTSAVYGKILTWAKDYSINFTHFMQWDALCTSKKPLTHFALVQAWLRQAAIIGADRQTKWDLIVPIYRGYDRDADFHPRDVSYIAIQVKNGKGFVPGWTGDFAAHIQGLEGKDTTEHDRLLLWIDLNKTSQIEAVCNESTSHHMHTGRQASAQPTRYNLRIDGHGTGTYEVLNTYRATDRPEQLGNQLDLCVQSMGAYRSAYNTTEMDTLRDRKLCQGRFVPFPPPYS